MLQSRHGSVSFSGMERIKRSTSANRLQGNVPANWPAQKMEQKHLVSLSSFENMQP